PAAIFLIIAGKTWFGIGLLLWSLIVIANIDNILRPYLVRREVNLHELLVFISSMGGIATFGFFGVILGPVIAALLKTSLQIYAESQGPPAIPS
ncbi:AI-2E family transporter, partial [candidate division KSB1 bacterium]